MIDDNNGVSKLKTKSVGIVPDKDTDAVEQMPRIVFKEDDVSVKLSDLLSGHILVVERETHATSGQTWSCWMPGCETLKLPINFEDTEYVKEWIQVNFQHILNEMRRKKQEKADVVTKRLASYDQGNPFAQMSSS